MKNTNPTKMTKQTTDHPSTVQQHQTSSSVETVLKEQQVSDLEMGEANEAIEEANENKSGIEIGGRSGPEPTRFGDWEKNGRCIDF